MNPSSLTPFKHIISTGEGIPKAPRVPKFTSSVLPSSEAIHSKPYKPVARTSKLSRLTKVYLALSAATFLSCISAISSTTKTTTAVNEMITECKNLPNKKVRQIATECNSKPFWSGAALECFQKATQDCKTGNKQTLQSHTKER